MLASDYNSSQIDVHYGLPKEEDMKGKCDKDKNQVCRPLSQTLPLRGLGDVLRHEES